MHKQKQKNWIKRIILMILLSLVLVINAPQIVNHVAENGNSYTAYAADGDPAAPTAETEAQTQQAMSSLRGFLQLQRFLDRLLWPVLYMIGGLMDNSLLFGGGMGARLRDLWVPIRNIVNIFFVIGLLGIALYNILGIGEDGGTFAIKTVLPNLIVGIIAVNFSFLVIKVALDAVNVITTAIYALPNEIDDTGLITKKQEEALCLNLAGKTSKEGETMTKEDLNEARDSAALKRIAQKYSIEILPGDKAASIAVKRVSEVEPRDPKYNQASFEKEVEGYKENKICDGKELAKSGKAYFDKFKSSNVAMALALNMSNFHMISKQEIASLKTIDDIGKLAVNALFGVVMYILFAASFVALLLVLVARLVVMWLSIIVSPLLIVAMAVPSLKEKMGPVNKISEHFVKHLIVPIPIALSLSVGWIMLKAMQLEKMNSELAEGTDFSYGIPVMGMSTLQELVVAVGCIAVVWMGVFTAAGDTIAGTATNWIGEKLKAAGSFIGKAPFKYGKFIPIGGGKYSMGALATFADRVQDKLNRPNESLVNTDLGKQFGIGGEVTAENLKSATTAKDYIGAMKDQTMMSKIRGGTLTSAEMKRTGAAQTELNTGYRKTAAALAAYDRVQADKASTPGQKKAAGEALYKAIDEEGKGIDATTGGTTTPAADAATTAAAAAAAGKKPGKKDPPAAENPKEPSAEYQEVFKDDSGGKYYTDAAGNVAKWNADKGELEPALSADDALLKDTSNKAAVTEGQESLEKAGAERVKAEGDAAVAAERARQAAREKEGGRYTAGSITGAAGRGGTIFTNTRGTITLVKSETEVYEVDPASGELKKLEPAQITANKAGRGTEVGKADGAVTIDPAQEKKLRGEGVTKLAALKGTLGIKSTS